ncbi:unnamed protein product [Coffea canephora]|uniref:NLP1-9 GAF domain-containing protein n=1 Tax=Coffea canephora TaxID=49390 RepID=A0A068V528_COFCA|nr:unnamed protein product [Coffea canephora]
MMAPGLLSNVSINLLGRILGKFLIIITSFQQVPSYSVSQIWNSKKPRIGEWDRSSRYSRLLAAFSSTKLQMATMEAQTSPSPPFSTEGLGPGELSCSHSLNDHHEHKWVFWSTCGNDEGRCGKPHHLSATADGAVIKDHIMRFLHHLFPTFSYWKCLVQFWGLVKIGDETYLTTRDQPFALQYYCFHGQELKKLCEYRKHCLAYSIPVDEDDDDHEIGPPGRVFRSGLPEFALDVRDYTIREYPQRDYAIGCVGGYWALPIYHHPTQHFPIGVLEIASPRDFNGLARWLVLEKLQEKNLTITRVILAAASSCQDGEIAIIEEALSKVRQIRGLGYAESWTTSGEILSSRRGLDFVREGQGVVGRAFSSKSACFCRDVRQLSITEYPLVVQARSYKYSACFAVCLQSPCPKNCIYVLEFFLHVNEKDEDEEDPRTLLNSLMETLKECLGISFKIASGQELGQKLTVEVIKVSPEDEFGSFVICSTTVIGGEGMTKLQMAPFSVEGLGPCELISSHSFNNYYHLWVFWSTCGNDEGRCGEPHHLSATAHGAVFTDDIKCCLQLVMETLIPCHCLVQFWGLVKTRDKTYLTTCDQPFALHYCHFNGGDAKKLCEYGKHCLEYLFPVDEDDDDHEIGPPGRVFRSGLPEYAWNVGDYTSREYPQRDYAVGRVKKYWALPIYHNPIRHLPIGVLEIVSPYGARVLPRRRVLEKLQNLSREMNLTTTCVSLPAEANSCEYLSSIFFLPFILQYLG